MKEIIIDGEKIHTKEDLHDAFGKALDFPHWYGRNLDALHDCLTDIREDVMIRIVDCHALNEHLPLYGRVTVRVVRQACRDNPHLTCAVDFEDWDEDDEE